MAILTTQGISGLTEAFKEHFPEIRISLAVGNGVHLYCRKCGETLVTSPRVLQLCSPSKSVEYLTEVVTRHRKNCVNQEYDPFSGPNPWADNQKIMGAVISKVKEKAKEPEKPKYSRRFDLE